MAKITKVEEKKSTFQGKEKTSYLFTLDDGLTGYASNKAPWEFKEGTNVSYTKEVKKSSKGEYNLFTLTRVETPTEQQTPRETPKFIAPPHAKVDIMEMKFKSRMLLCELTHKLILDGKLDDVQAKLHLVAWNTEMDNLIDGLFV